MKLIDADALLKTIEKHCYQVWYDRTSIEKGMTLTGIRQAINEQPEAVIRCRDCIYWDTQDRSTVGIAKCNYQSVARYLAYTDADDFCSYGERKTDEKSI